MLRIVITRAALARPAPEAFVAGNLNHEIMDGLIHDGHNFLRVGLDLMPQFASGRIDVKIGDVEVQPRGAEKKHVLESLPVRLRLGIWRSSNICVRHTVSIHAILLGKVAQEVFERGKGIIDRHGGAPDEALSLAAKMIRFGGVGVAVGEGGGIGTRGLSLANHAPRIIEDDTARGARRPEGVRVDVASAMGCAASL